MLRTKQITLDLTGDEFDYLTTALGFQLEHDDGTANPPKEAGESLFHKVLESWDMMRSKR